MASPAMLIVTAVTVVLVVPLKVSPAPKALAPFPNVIMSPAVAPFPRKSVILSMFAAVASIAPNALGEANPKLGERRQRTAGALPRGPSGTVDP
jgi:hypothetical protein